MTRMPRPAEHVRRRAGSAGKAAGGARSVESLYPFLYAGALDPAKVVAEAHRSTVDKTREIIDLRAEVLARSDGLLAECAKDLATRFRAGGRLLAFGNGGSATDAADLVALFMYQGADVVSLPAIGLSSDPAVLTALANDVGVEVMFARQLAALGRAADIAFGLSTSGNSENLLRAFDVARRAGMMTVGVSGYDGGKMAELESLDYLFIAPSTSVHRIQEAQTTICHVLWELVVAEFGQSPVGT
jgi:D-sedoheptulose 7-phosphate isomerase